MCNNSHWNRLQLADTRSQSHRWEYGPVGQKLVSLELPEAALAAVVSAVADMAQLGDLWVVEEQLFDMSAVVVVVGGLLGEQLGTVSLVVVPPCVHLGGHHLVESS